MYLYLLNKAGYPFSKDDIDANDWRLIGLTDVIVGRMEAQKAAALYTNSLTVKDGIICPDTNQIP